MAITKGSEKQIAWAEKIQADWEKQIKENHQQMLASHAKKPATPKLLAFSEGMYADALASLELINDARWLIDRRTWPITASDDQSIINALIPDLQERINALPEMQERNKKRAIEVAASIEATRVELKAAEEEFARIDALRAERLTETADELAELEAIASSWTDEQVEIWSPEMSANVRRREDLEVYLLGSEWSAANTRLQHCKNVKILEGRGKN